MPLVQCPDCKNEVSDRANACPTCGFPIQELLEQAAEDECLKPIQDDIKLNPNLDIGKPVANWFGGGAVEKALLEIGEAYLGSVHSG